MTSRFPLYRSPLFCSPFSNRLVLAALLLFFITAGCRMHFQRTSDRLEARNQAGSLERGRNLAFNICAGCHYDPVAKKFIGRSLNDLPKIAGHLYSANLTHSTALGVLPDYSDAELFYLLKTGINRSGEFMPYMMRPMMADEDINDLIVFLRSNDPALEAADTLVGRTRINFLGKAGIRFLSHPQPYNKGVARPNEQDAIAYGRYLVGIIGCYHCHSSKVRGLNYLDPERSKGYLQGGIKLKDPAGHRIFGPNLTPDMETGIGGFSEEDFKKAVREGLAPSGKTLSPPMGRFRALTNQQVHALYAYLQSLPPKHHRVKRRS